MQNNFFRDIVCKKSQRVPFVSGLRWTPWDTNRSHWTPLDVQWPKEYAKPPNTPDLLPDLAIGRTKSLAILFSRILVPKWDKMMTSLIILSENIYATLKLLLSLTHTLNLVQN